MARTYDASFSRRTLLRGAAGALALPALGGAAFAAGRGPEDLRKAGVARVGCEAAYRPFTFRDGGKIVGYDVDLAGLLFQPLGVTVEMVDTAWAGVIPALYAGNFDVIMTSLTYTKERVQKVGYTIPYTEATQELLIRAGDAGTIKSLDGMAGKILGVKLGSAGDTMKTALEAKLKAATGKGFSEIKTYDDHPAAYLALAQGSVDGVINALPTLTQVTKDAPGRYAIVRDIGPRNWAGIGLRKEDVALTTFLDERIAALKASGEIYALQEKWFGIRMDLADKVPTFT
ncbi:transporter substrate-binding domain-containing protein [Methylobacterium dankookense]|uniref:L-cystine-binding protein FliY n=1 Tax=Methylobacterium dankookense TaxID=560405 RepID=A0A564G482_9HYPH|nr:transporter substrate-binding domain-containing protein [Methylobacterium dankookense]GJD56527.1 L-cystine-binding protein FliY [Methylobacterium dankookense]VUF15323.1 L-cystine-binding protein FliY [Methylobacterium dankookense]